MSFRTHHTLTGYARAAVDLKARMDEHVRGAGFREFLGFFLDTRLPSSGQPRLAERVADTVSQAAGSVWRIGEPFVLAPTTATSTAPCRRWRRSPGRRSAASDGAGCG